MRAAVYPESDERGWAERMLARFVAVVAIGLVAASGGLLAEMSRLANAQEPSFAARR